MLPESTVSCHHQPSATPCRSKHRPPGACLTDMCIVVGVDGAASSTCALQLGCCGQRARLFIYLPRGASLINPTIPNAVREPRTVRASPTREPHRQIPFLRCVTFPCAYRKPQYKELVLVLLILLSSIWKSLQCLYLGLLLYCFTNRVLCLFSLLLIHTPSTRDLIIPESHWWKYLYTTDLYHAHGLRWQNKASHDLFVPCLVHPGPCPCPGSWLFLYPGRRDPANISRGELTGIVPESRGIGNVPGRYKVI